MSKRRAPTTTSSFGVGRREAHDSSRFYARFSTPRISTDANVAGPPVLGEACIQGDSGNMAEIPDNSVALVITSPPYFVGKEYEEAVVSAGSGNGERPIPSSYEEFLQMLHSVFAECTRVLEPGGRIAVNVANLGRKPYRSLAGDVITILEDLGLLLRGEIVWQKARSSSGSCAWGSFASPANPVLRDTTERVIVAGKGRFDRALSAAERRKAGLPWEATISNDEFVAATLDVWEIPAESARRVEHPAPFPVELPQKLIELYTYAGDAVLDPFMGSGSTLVAAARSGRVPIGYDIDPGYVTTARERLADEAATVGRAGPTVGQKAATVAERALEAAGFRVVREKPTLRGVGVSFSFLVEGSSGPFYVEVPGGYTTSRPGLQSSEAVWKVLGQAGVLNAAQPETPLLILAPALPRRRSGLDKTLRAVGPSAIFDLVELGDGGGIERLKHYATATDPSPRPGFWTTADLDRLSGLGAMTLPNL